jgi:nicotinamide-nucleotide amidase
LIVEVIAVGTELLIGQIVNTNGAFIGAKLAEEGHDAHFQVIVGDNLARLTASVEQAHARADAVVITGGIGPTQDDLTREALCRVGGRRMTRDQAHAAWIEDRIRSQRGSVNPTVLRMADLPEGSVGLPNGNGVALGVAMEHQGKWIFAVPGVPVEMRAMIEAEVMPRLRRLTGEPAVLRSRVLRTWGMGESQVAEVLDDLFTSAANPSVAYLISDMEVKVRITAKAVDLESAEALITPTEREIRSRLGEAVFAVDDQTIEGLIVAELAERGWALATVEQATLGQVGARVAAVPGATGVFAGTMLPGSSEAAAPRGDVVLAVGPIGADQKEGRRTTRPVEMTVSTPEQVVRRVFDLGGDDERVRTFATIAGLHLIRIALEGGQ